jgi:hypothetical protein
VAQRYYRLQEEIERVEEGSMTRLVVVAIGIFVLAGCGGAAEPVSTRALPGVSGRQALGAARLDLVERGYRIESFDPGKGLLATHWRDRNGRSMRYEVQVAFDGGAGEGNATGIEVAVTVKARDRVIGGWSGEYPVPWAAGDLIDDIERAVARIEGPVPEPDPVLRVEPAAPALQPVVAADAAPAPAPVNTLPVAAPATASTEATP